MHCSQKSIYTSIVIGFQKLHHRDVEGRSFLRMKYTPLRYRKLRNTHASLQIPVQSGKLLLYYEIVTRDALTNYILHNKPITSYITFRLTVPLHHVDVGGSGISLSGTIPLQAAKFKVSKKTYRTRDKLRIICVKTDLLHVFRYQFTLICGSYLIRLWLLAAISNLTFTKPFVSVAFTNETRPEQVKPAISH